METNYEITKISYLLRRRIICDYAYLIVSAKLRGVY